MRKTVLNIAETAYGAAVFFSLTFHINNTTQPVIAQIAENNLILHKRIIMQMFNYAIAVWFFFLRRHPAKL